MAKSIHPIKFWRGTRSAYNALSSYDPYTYYTVRETNGTWKSFYGIAKVSGPAGELEPVLSILNDITDISTFTQGDRYLIGHDSIYYVVEIGPSASGSEGYAVNMVPLGNYSVKVMDRLGKRYQLVNGVLKTYDDGDCGSF